MDTPALTHLLPPETETHTPTFPLNIISPLPAVPAWSSFVDFLARSSLQEAAVFIDHASFALPALERGSQPLPLRHLRVVFRVHSTAALTAFAREVYGELFALVSRCAQLQSLHVECQDELDPEDWTGPASSHGSKGWSAFVSDPRAVCPELRSADVLFGVHRFLWRRSASGAGGFSGLRMSFA
jgi:hypothetical protein